MKSTKDVSVCSQINARDASGQTPLHLACERGDVVCVKELLEESQARTDIKDRNGETPMHSAAKQDSPAVIQVSFNWSEVSVSCVQVLLYSHVFTSLESLMFAFIMI